MTLKMKSQHLLVLDVLCHVIKEDVIFEWVNNVNILSDNADTYSANIFDIAAFDVVNLHQG